MKNDIIFSSDFTNLKNNIKSEFSRRNISSTVNSSRLSQFSKDYTKTAEKNNYIYTSHANESIDQLINYLKGKDLVDKTKQFDYVSSLEDYFTIVNDLALVTDLTTSNHGCDAICIGLCSGACYGGCNGCSGCTGVRG